MSVPTEVQIGKLVPENVALSTLLHVYTTSEFAKENLRFAIAHGQYTHVGKIYGRDPPWPKEDIQERNRKDINGIILNGRNE